MGDDAGQVDRRFDAGVAAADHGNPLALEQRTVAMRAEADALGLVFLLAGHVHFTPAGAGGEDDGLAFHRGAVFELDLEQVAGGQPGCPLQVHHVHFIRLDVLFQCRDQLRSFGFLDRDEVLDAQGIHHLAAETLGQHAGADALAGGIDGRRGAGRSAADDQHVESLLGRNLFGGPRGGAGIESGDDFLDAHPALAEFLAIQIDRRHGHDLAGIHLVLEHRAIDHRAAYAGVEYGHQVQRLNDIGAVVAGERNEGLESEAAGQGLDLLDHGGVDLGRMAAGLQQGEDQRRKLMAHRDAGEMDARRFARQADGKGRAQRGIAVLAQADLGGERRDVEQQAAHFLRLGAVVKRRDELDRALQFFQVGL